MTTSMYIVHGMNCEHCANSITPAVGEVLGATGVVVDLPIGKVAEEAGFQAA
jgi:copper chaperone CopZ